MPNYCPCCDTRLTPADHADIVRYSKHVMTHMVDNQAPVDHRSTCHEQFQRKVPNKAREFHQSRQTLMMAGMAGHAILAGAWAGRMLRQSPYWGPHI